VSKKPKILSVFTLVMINVIAVDSLRTVPISAKLGLALVSYYILAALAFFIPVALVAAELATTYPRNGGLFIWVKEAFGQRMGFTTIWLQWIYNLIWFPTILLFIASTSAYVFNLDLAENKLFLIITVLSLFWLFTGLNCLGLRIASMISTIGAILGTLVPMLGIMSMAGWWLIQGKVPANAFGSQSILPDLSSLHSVAMFIVVIFGLMGIEMSAVHAEDVKHPKKDYPKAIFYSAIIIILTLVLSALSILVVVPQSKLSVVTGLVEA
jgi:amino acid transporter